MTLRNSPDPAVVTKALSLGYDVRHPVLRDLDLAIPAGQVTTLVGPNGAGKSTLLLAFAGLLSPLAGVLEVLGAPAPADPARVALVLQASVVNDRMPVTVREVVAMGRYARAGMLRRLSRADWAAVDDALGRLGVGDLAGRHIGELSGGQRQRVFVAQGLVQEAELLLLDEPVTGLDIVSREHIVEAVTDERDRGRSVVISTHDLGQAAATDHIVLLSGEVIATGNAEHVFTAEHLSTAYGERLVRLADGGIVLDDTPHHGHPH